MLIEKRVRGNEKHLILIPSPDEAKLLDEILGSHVQTDDGLITDVVGQLRVADGYGPSYISLKAVTTLLRRDE